MKSKFELFCDCGNQMIIESFMSMNGMKVDTRGYTKSSKKIPVVYTGKNQNWKCKKCGKRIESFIGLDLTDYQSKEKE